MRRGLGLLERACSRCRWRGIGSAGERCPECGAYSDDYGPVFFGYEQHWVMMANRRSDGALINITRKLSLEEWDKYDADSAMLVELWRPRREPWNRQWVGEPRPF